MNPIGATKIWHCAKDGNRETAERHDQLGLAH